MAVMSESKKRFHLDAGKDEPVPAILHVPSAAAPVPGVLLLHGLNSNKERMADSVGAALARRGVASLAVDLPSHGSRTGDLQELSLQNPLAIIRLWRLALHEADAAVRFLGAHPSIDANRIAIAGYSLGAVAAVFVAARNQTVRAVALAAGGDLPPKLPMERLVRSAADPQKAVRALEGRPLLMVNGRDDRTVRPVQAEALFAAAKEPKELRWYAGGHWPPERVIEDVAIWLSTTLGAARPA